MRRALAFELALFALPSGGALLLWLGGLAPAWSIPLASVPALGRHIFRLVDLSGLIRRQHRLAPPFPHGLWGEVYRNIARYQQRGRKGRKRQIRFTRRFREAANAVPDALVILDKHHRIDWANPAAAQLLDVHWPDQDGQHFLDVFSHPDLGDFLQDGEYLRPLDIAPVHNRALMVSLRIAPFGERRRQRLVVGRDITKVYHLNMIRRDFVANASHELRTPLTVIGGFVENLLDAPNTPEAHRRPLTLMHNQAERMRSIIEDLLTLSRLEMHDSPADQHSIDVPEELRLILQEAQAIGDDNHRLDPLIDTGLLLLGSQPELCSAFSNLVFNAIKHTPAGTRIRIHWYQDKDGAAFVVEDDGPGIAPEHLPRLTERFYRIDAARSRQSGGTGLGLAIVKHVLNRHDASLNISSELGQGTTFACHFPATRALRRDDPIPHVDTTPPPASPHRSANGEG
ncbi:phosphate regulon sensor histidine kinase PhoR [Marichromatium bheemlicum]|uniref:Phosphate regulon sensor protein PhoR n=1 Tax=Marichromatium bheemlicum TaxID=365339 RepID=A0ABX1I580_9GAMM|nr:phosphate regulon sensor histidine kinase PhoR [Marichromatium bheemlicum]NKN32597.1 phosphate regulon sensor histidine kinase PhoR [Marichromatium bheemlicum]